MSEELFELAPQAMALLDPSGQLLRFNQQFSSLFGYQPTELLACTIEFLLPDFQRLLPVEPRSEVFYLELRGQSKEASEIPLKVGVRLLKTKDQGACLLLSCWEMPADVRCGSDTAEMEYRLLEHSVTERRHLSQQLHQGLLQEIQGLNYAFAALAAEPGIGAEVTKELGQMRASAQRAIQQVRALQQELFPPTLADFGVAAALRSYAKLLQERRPTLHIELMLADDTNQLPLTVRAALFDIGKEALTNIGARAEASTVKIRLTLDKKNIELEISDEGRGFDVPSQSFTISNEEHLGLMRALKQAQAIRGQCQIRSERGKGTSLRVVVPIISQP